MQRLALLLGASGLVLSSLAWTGPAAAQNTTLVVGTCGTASYTAGTKQYPTQDTTGVACASTAGGGVTTVQGNVSNGASTVAPTSTNVGTVSYNYYWDGAAWQKLDGNPVLVTPQATENHLGEVGGNQLTVTVAQTVTASSAYASGNAIGGLMTLSNAARVAQGSGLLQSVVDNSKSAQTGQVDVFIFNANPSGSTCTDKTAFVLASADFDKVIGVASIVTANWYAGNTASVGQAVQQAMPYQIPSGTTMYACAVTRSTPTYASTSDESFKFTFLRN